MSEFLTSFQSDTLPDGRKKLLAPLLYQSDLLKRTVIVPTGYITDLDSVPRWPVIFWLFKGVGGDEPGALHDWLYSSHEVTRSVADAVFIEAMKAKGAGAWRRWPVWAAVRIRGGSHWDNKSEKQVKPAPADDIYFG